MIYTLCHKDIKVLNFKIEDDEIIDVLNIINKKHLPIGIFNEYEKGLSSKKQFRQWWKNRAIPASRQNLKDALEILGNITTEQLVNKSFGLSLSDQYWAKPQSSNLNWKDINFFENDFSEDVGKALFGNLYINELSDINLISPDNTSDGWLKKKWIIEKGERILLKGGSNPYLQEPFNEVLASEICKRLNIIHIEYQLVENDKKYYSACKDYITPDTELISAFHIRNVLKKTNNDSEYKHLLKCCEAVGMTDIESIERQLCKMFIVDCITANSDRHLNNFGFIRNANTLEWKGVFPVYDTGSSLFYSTSEYMLRTGYADDPFKAEAKPFAKTHQEQIKKLPCSKYCIDLPFENLSDIDIWFNKLLEKNEYISPERRNILSEILKSRVIETERLLKLPELFNKPYKNKDRSR